MPAADEPRITNCESPIPNLQLLFSAASISMAIFVVCPGCKSRFQVSDKFAGRSGSCPKCKGKITVPAAADEVKVHGGEDFSGGGRNAEGKLVLKPIARQETRFRPALAAAIAAGVLLTLLLDWLGGRVLRDHLTLLQFAGWVGLLIVTPPLAIGAYTVLYDDELEPYRGNSLYLRAASCALVYILLWGIFNFIVAKGLTGEIWSWLFVAPPFLVMGALTALACFDLDFSNGIIHYAFYVLVIILLRWIAGMGWVWQS